jgi:hypothetical protein
VAQVCLHCGRAFQALRTKVERRGYGLFCSPRCRGLGARTKGATLAQRLYANVYLPNGENGCWIWRAGTSHGYGRLTVNHHNVRAHRLSYEVHVGPIPDGMLVLHLRECSTKACINPRHLYVGTNRDNYDDAVATGAVVPGARRPPVRYGTANNKSKLTPGAVQALRRLVAEGLSAHEVGRRYGVSHKTVSAIIHRRTWKHVP